MDEYEKLEEELKKVYEVHCSVVLKATVCYLLIYEMREDKEVGAWENQGW